jgi:CheY-like chemotaxis protein
LRVQQAPLAIETLDGVQVDGRIESLDAAKGRMVVSVPQSPSAGMDADDEVRLFFSAHESRWMGLGRIHYHNDSRNRFTLILPKRLDPSERRRETRLFLDAAENVKAVFSLQGSGRVQATGRLSSLSVGGFRLSVEGARDRDGGWDLDPGDVPLEENRILDSILITGLRESPLEVQGIVLEVDPQPLGPVLGIRFRALPREDMEFLRGFIDARTRALPVQPPRPAAPEAPPAPEPSAEAPPPAQTDPRIKRFKTLALVMPPGPEREALRAFLATRGFTRVLPAGTLSELAMGTRKFQPDVFLVDWPDATMPELDIVLFLGKYPFPSPPRILLACANATTQLIREADRLGVSHLLVKPYALDDALVDLLLRHLGAD